MSIPFDGIPLLDQVTMFKEMEDLGYSDLWSAESNGTDGFTPLALASQVVPTMHLGTTVIPAFTRGPGLMAMSVATLAELAPGRFSFGIGSSSNIIVDNWNSVPFDEPYRKVRDMVRFLKVALTGEKVDHVFDTFSVRGFRLARPLPVQPQILVGALRPGMLHLAAKEADGAVINWLSAEDVKQVVREIGPGKEVVARIFVCPSKDAELVRKLGRLAIAAYLNVPVYAAFHRWLGRTLELEPMWEAWEAGDRKGAARLIPDSVVDSLIVHGSPDKCREHILRYVENGVTVPIIGLLPFSIDTKTAISELAPRG